MGKECETRIKEAKAIAGRGHKTDHGIGRRIGSSEIESRSYGLKSGAVGCAMEIIMDRFDRHVQSSEQDRSPCRLTAGDRWGRRSIRIGRFSRVDRELEKRR